MRMDESTAAQIGVALSNVLGGNRDRAVELLAPLNIPDRLKAASALAETLAIVTGIEQPPPMFSTSVLEQ